MRWRFGLSLAHVRVLANVRPALASVAERRVWAVAGGREGPSVRQAGCGVTDGAAPWLDRCRYGR